MARPCMKLVHNQPPGQNRGNVDVCELEHGHEGPHRGKYRGMVWAVNAPGEPPNIIEHGGTTVAHDR